MSKFKKNRTPWNKNKVGYQCKSKKLELFPEIKRLIAENNSSTQIAKQLNIHPKTVFTIIQRVSPLLEKKLREIGLQKISENRIKVTKDMIKEMLYLSGVGKGVDLIGQKIGVDGTTARRYLKKELGEKEYKKRHSIKKYTDYWSGRYFTNKRGDRLQSGLEEMVVDFLYENNIKYKTQTCLVLPEGKFYPDVELLEYKKYIEIFGMSDLDFYRIKMNRKIKIYNKNNVNFIDLNKENFSNFKQIILKKLKIC